MGAPHPPHPRQRAPQSCLGARIWRRTEGGALSRSCRAESCARGGGLHCRLVRPPPAGANTPNQPAPAGTDLRGLLGPSPLQACCESARTLCRGCPGHTGVQCERGQRSPCRGGGGDELPPPSSPKQPATNTARASAESRISTALVWPLSGATAIEPTPPSNLIGWTATLEIFHLADHLGNLGPLGSACDWSRLGPCGGAIKASQWSCEAKDRAAGSYTIIARIVSWRIRLLKNLIIRLHKQGCILNSWVFIALSTIAVFGRLSHPFAALSRDARPPLSLSNLRHLALPRLPTHARPTSRSLSALCSSLRPPCGNRRPQHSCPPRCFAGGAGGAGAAMDAVLCGGHQGLLQRIDDLRQRRPGDCLRVPVVWAGVCGFPPPPLLPLRPLVLPVPLLPPLLLLPPLRECHRCLRRSRCRCRFCPSAHTLLSRLLLVILTPFLFWPQRSGGDALARGRGCSLSHQDLGVSRVVRSSSVASAFPPPPPAFFLSLPLP